MPDNGEYQIRWLGGVPHTEPDPTRDMQYAGAYARVGDDVEKISVASDARKEFTATGPDVLCGRALEVFHGGADPRDACRRRGSRGSSTPPPRRRPPRTYYDLTLRQAWKGNATGRWSVYWGPIKHRNLEAFGVGLDGIDELGLGDHPPDQQAVLWALEAPGPRHSQLRPGDRHLQHPL